MEKIASFTVNHLTLLRGIYVSRRDTTPSGDTVTTLDIRMTEPNRMEPLSGACLHTIEHLAATFLRNHPQWGSRIIYWGPMGCCTGCYLLVSGHVDSADMVSLIDETFAFIADYDGPIPGASPRDCGNYSFMDIEAARTQARRYLTEVVRAITPARLSYPE